MDERYTFEISESREEVSVTFSTSLEPPLDGIEEDDALHAAALGRIIATAPRVLLNKLVLGDVSQVSAQLVAIHMH